MSIMRLPNEVSVEIDGHVAPNPRVFRHYNAQGERVTHDEITTRLYNTAKKMQQQLNDDLAVDVSDLADFSALSVLDIEQQAADMPENISDRLVHTGNPRSLGPATSATTKTVSIREFLDPVGYYEEINGDNDDAPYMSRELSSETMTLHVTGLAHKESLSLTLADTTYDPTAVNRAFARALVIEKNREVLAPIIGATYTGNIIAAVTSGSDWFANFRATLIKGIAKVNTNTFTIGSYTSNVEDLSGQMFVLLPPGVMNLLDIRYAETTDLTLRQTFGNATFLALSQGMIAPYGAKPSPAVKIPANTAYVIYLPNYQAASLRVTPVEDMVKTGTGTARSGGAIEVAHFRYSGVFNTHLLPAGAGKGCIIQVTLPNPAT